MTLLPYTLAHARSFGVTENSQPVQYKSVPSCACSCTQRDKGTLKSVLRAIDIFKTFQGIGTQRKTKTGTLWRVHRAIRSDGKRFVKQFPHHRHIALGYFQDMA